MMTVVNSLKAAQVGEICAGFRLMKKEDVAAKHAQLYTLRHEKTGAQLIYLDRADENKTFAVSFTTLPEDDTGVFHILEHSVLNGSRKYPVKEPFVSLLQSSMQTFLNAMTYDDKTLYPVSSRNEQDFFNLMSVYLDAVFCPLIYERPEIFMQEGWHYEFDEQAQPYYNGVVFSEMKGAYADVDRLLEEESCCILFPDTSYGYRSGGHPEHIPELSYEQFLNAHRRFYHPSNAKFFLDGQMDVDAVLRFIDEEYLSHYEYREPTFAFALQTPCTAERTLYYEAQEEGALAHMALSRILCTYADVEKIYAAKILADYLTGSNEAPLKRAFLERGLAQDVDLVVNAGVLQPSISLLIRNTEKERFDEVRALVPEVVRDLLAEGLNTEALMASLERFAFADREIREPYGVELVSQALDSWLYGGDPLAHLDNSRVFASLRTKPEYFAQLLDEMLGSSEDKSCVYLLPSTTKGQEDVQREEERLRKVTATWNEEAWAQARAACARMQSWQQSADSEEALASVPHLVLADVPEDVEPVQTELACVAGREVLKVATDTNGIVYLNLFFDLSDFSLEELRMANVLCGCLGELRTEHMAADALQTKIKALFGGLGARVELMAKPGDLQDARPYLTVSASLLEEHAAEALALLGELLLCGRYDESERIDEIVQQSEYFVKQALIGEGHTFAITKALSGASRAGAVKELLDGESFVRWFSAFAGELERRGEEVGRQLRTLAERAFARNRLFVGYSGVLQEEALRGLIESLALQEIGEPVRMSVPEEKNCTVEIPSAVGYCALGHNLYALEGTYSGACAVLSSLMTYGYLWNAVRVQGGAYGTGMSIRANGDIFCYSYRDPNPENSRAAFAEVADVLEDFLSQNEPLDDFIIGTVNTTDPLLDPAGVCHLMCSRYLQQVTAQDIARIRREILHTTGDDLRQLVELLRAYAAQGKFCAVGSAEAVAFASGK